MGLNLATLPQIPWLDLMGKALVNDKGNGKVGKEGKMKRDGRKQGYGRKGKGE